MTDPVLAPVLAIDRLSAAISRGPVLLHDISLRVAAGEVHGLVGTSGAGKSMIGRCVLGILPAAVRITGGSIRFLGENLVGLSERARRAAGASLALIPQDPLSALNPSRRIAAQMTDVMRLRLGLSHAEAQARALAMLDEVKIRDAKNVLRRYPHELSGGMRQRVLIATAFACEPRLIVADEPTTALDVVVQREILQEVEALKRDFGFAVLFITHDLSLLLEFADRIAIMYAGEIVETAPAATLAESPLHPYTQGLLQSFPPLTGPRVKLNGIAGAPPDLREPPAGCRFHPRCLHCVPDNVALYFRQTTERPRLREITAGHFVACHLVDA